MVSIRSIALVVLMLNLGAAVPCSAHPFHISTAEMEFNSKTGKFEVALKLHANDLERALMIQAGHRLNLDLWTEESVAGLSEDEKVKQLSELKDATEVYLTKHFCLVGSVAAKRGDAVLSTESNLGQSSDANLKRLTRVQLVGHEFESSWLWLYFELGMPSTTGESDSLNSVVRGAEPIKLQNSVLLDIIDKQINTVSIRYSRKRATLKMTKKQPQHVFEAAWFDRIDAKTPSVDDAGLQQ